MDDKYIGYLPSVLAVLGIAFQWVLRVRKDISDSFTISLAVVLAILGWALCSDWHNVTDWQGLAIQTLLQLPGYVTSILGPLYATSHFANKAVERGADPASPIVPKTDSK